MKFLLQVLTVSTISERKQFSLRTNFGPTCKEPQLQRTSECRLTVEKKMTDMASMCSEMGIPAFALGEANMDRCRERLRDCGFKMDKVTEKMRAGAADTMKKQKCEMNNAYPGLFPDADCPGAVTMAHTSSIPSEYYSDCPTFKKPDCQALCDCADALGKAKHNHSLIEGYYKMLDFEKRFCEQAAGSSEFNIPEECQVSAVCA